MHKFLLVISFALLSVAAMAQCPGCPVRTPEDEAHIQTVMLQRALNLTEQQCDTIYTIHLKYALLREQHPSREQVFAMVEMLQQELKGVLTEAQYNNFIQHTQGRNPHPRHAYEHGMGGPGMPPPPAEKDSMRRTPPPPGFYM